MGKNRIIGLYIIIVYVFFVAFSFLLPLFYRSNVIAAAGINSRIHFQGKVVNANGTNVTDGTYDFVFKMYSGVGSSATALFTESWTSAALFSSTMSTAPSSGGETLTYSSNTNESTLKVGQILWNTTKEESVYITSVDTGTNVLGISPTRQAWAGADTITNKIFVKDGIFVVELNSLNTDFSGVDFNSDTIYLGMNFNADGEMKPRIQYTSVPYAFNAQKVNGLTVTNTTGTFTLTSSKTLAVSNTLTFAGTDGTTFTFPSGSGTVVTLDSTGTLTNKTIGSTGLTFSGATTDITTGTNEHFSIIPNGSGNVGIGTTSPTNLFEVRGTSTQVKVSYDSSNFATLGVDSSGYLTVSSGATNAVGRVLIGLGGGGNATPDLFGLDVKSDTGDPAGGFEGAMYYNTSDNKFRCYQGAAWTDCIGSGGAGPFTDGTGITYLTDTAENLGIGTTSSVDKLAVVKSSTASDVDGISIAFTQTDDTDATDTNTGLQIDITNSSTDADNLYGINIAGITGGTATEYALVIGSGWDRGLSVASASTFTAALTTESTLTVGSTGNTFTFNPASGPVYAGTARPAKQLKFAAEYEGATLTASGSASATGNMTADTTRDADLGWMNYYEWTSVQGSLQDYSVAVKIKLPSDFAAWATSNAVQINFATEVTDTAKNKLDVWIYNMTENPDQVVARSLTNGSSPAADWEVLTIDDSEIDDNTAPDWDAADETAIIYLKASSLVDAVNCTGGYDNGCYVRLGDITLNYLSKF